MSRSNSWLSRIGDWLPNWNRRGREVNFSDDTEVEFRLPQDQLSAMSAPAANINFERDVPARRVGSAPSRLQAEMSNPTEDSDDDEFYDSHSDIGFEVTIPYRNEYRSNAQSYTHSTPKNDEYRSSLHQGGGDTMGFPKPHKTSHNPHRVNNPNMGYQYSPERYDSQEIHTYPQGDRRYQRDKSGKSYETAPPSMGNRQPHSAEHIPYDRAEPRDFDHLNPYPSRHAQEAYPIHALQPGQYPQFSDYEEQNDVHGRLQEHRRTASRPVPDRHVPDFPNRHVPEYTNTNRYTRSNDMKSNDEFGQVLSTYPADNIYRPTQRDENNKMYQNAVSPNNAPSPYVTRNQVDKSSPAGNQYYGRANDNRYSDGRHQDHTFKPRPVGPETHGHFNRRGVPTQDARYYNREQNDMRPARNQYSNQGNYKGKNADGFSRTGQQSVNNRSQNAPKVNEIVSGNKSRSFTISPQENTTTKFVENVEQHSDIRNKEPETQNTNTITATSDNHVGNLQQNNRYSNAAGSTQDQRDNRRGGNRLKQRDPKSFDGVRAEWSDYLPHFETVAAWNGWDSSQRAQQLIMSLEGEAMKMLGQLPTEVKDDYSQLVATLNRKYDPQERASAYKIEFRGRIRRKSEMIMSYAQELRRLVIRAYPEMASESHDAFVLDQFVMGLGSLELRRHVQFGHPTDINQAISLAIEFEAFETAVGPDRFRKPKGDVCLVQPADDDDDDDDDASGAVACPITDKRNLVCRYCKKTNHTIDQCFKLKNKREAEAKQAENDDKEQYTSNQGN